MVFLTLFFVVITSTVLVDGDVLPSRMEGQYASESLHTVSIKVGTPCKLMRLLIDFNSNKLVTRIPVQTFSRSFSPAFGGSDVVHFGGKDYRVLVTADGGLLAAGLGCPSCDGVLGLGSGSKIWLQADESIFTAGAVLLDEELIAFSRSTRGIGVVQCLPGFTNICTAPAVLEGMSVIVFFGVASTKTKVPLTIFNEYTSGLNVGVNDPEDWGNLRFKFPALPKPGDPSSDDSNHFTLRREDIVTKSRKTGYDLLLDSSGNTSVVVLSRSAWRSFMIRKNWITGTAQIVSWKVRKHWTVYALIVLLVTACLFLYWKLSPSGAWNIAYKAGWKVLAEGCGTTLAILTYALPTSQTALEGHVEVNIFLGCVLINMFLWQLFSCLVYFELADNFFGKVSITLEDVSKPAGIKGDIGMAEGEIWDHAPDVRVRYLNPRLWTVMGLSNETTVLILSLLLIMETRVETLGNFFILLFSLILLFNIMYHLLIALNIPTGDRWRFAWALYWTNAVIILVVGLIIVEVHMMSPFIERFIPAFPRIVPYVSAIVYAAVLPVASACARFRSLYEESMREEAIREIRKKHVT